MFSATGDALKGTIPCLKIRSTEGLFMHAGGESSRSNPPIGPEKTVDSCRKSTAPSPARHGGCNKEQPPRRLPSPASGRGIFTELSNRATLHNYCEAPFYFTPFPLGKGPGVRSYGSLHSNTRGHAFL